ncbi:hypothetical protein V8C37DRAFT_414555 [Trichoderma ceciliae]
MAEAIRMNPQPAPHPVLYAASFPRVHAENFPHGDRAAYSKYYPYGIPVTYKMMHGVHSQGVAQTYLEDNLPVGFYTNVPSKAKAIISTSNGSRTFRNLDHILPQRRIHLWSRDEIQAICNSLRKLYWNELKHMQQPHCWDDLWTYFDAHDLYHNGCINLWNIINTLWDENKLISVDVKREVAAHIGHWADEWLKLEENRERLTQWEESRGPIFRILSDKDHESLGLIQDDVVPLIASALKGRRTFLLSNKEKEQDEEPADLMTACRMNSVENWLTGQRVFDNNGLPPPPVSEPHRGPASVNEPTPCFMQDGKHYYLPQNCFPLLESPRKPAETIQSLQKSAGAAAASRPAECARPGVVIANGSNIPKESQVSVNKAYKEKIDEFEFQRQNDDRRIISMPETISPVISSSDLELRRSKTLLAMDNEISSGAKARRSSESSNLSKCGQKSPDSTLSIKKEGIETMMDRLKTAEQGHTEQGTAQQHGGRIQPRGENMQSTMYDTARHEQCQTQGAAGSLNDSAALKQLPSTQRTRRSPQEQRQLVESSLGAFVKQNLTAPVKGSTELMPFYMQPEKALAPHPTVPNGFSHQSKHFHPAPNKSLPHPMPCRDFSVASQVKPLPKFPTGTHSNSMPSVMPYNPPANGSDEINHLTQQSRLEFLYGSPTPSVHNGYRNNNRTYNRVGHRRGSQGQKTHVYVSGQQTQAEHQHHPMPHEVFLNKQWRRDAQQDGIRQSSWCRNPVGSNLVDYCHCTCSQCSERNRSIWVRVSPESFMSIMEVQVFLKFGIGNRFGQVEEAYPAPSQRRDAFIVRFVKESSVPQALAFGGGIIPEKNVRIAIQPVHRSKWMKHQQQQQPRKVSSSPNAHQQPIRNISPQSNMNLTYSQTATPSPSLAPSHIRKPELGQLENPSGPSGASALTQAYVSRQGVAQQIELLVSESACGTILAEPPNQILMSAPIHHIVALKEGRMYPEPEPTSPGVMTSVPIQNIKKKSISQPKPPLEETLGGKDDNCGIVTPGGHDSTCCSPKKARVALSSTPMEPTSHPGLASGANLSKSPYTATEDGSHTQKRRERDAKEFSAVGKKDRRRSTTVFIENDGQDGESNNNILASSGQKKTQQFAPKTMEKLALAVTTSPEKRPESASMNGYIRISSIFTEEEIKERKQAWNRIPMPLDPRKSKKLGTTAITGQSPMLHNPNGPSSNATEETGVSTSCIGEQHQLELSEMPGASYTQLEQSMEEAEVSINKVQQLVEDESFILEQGLDAPTQSSLALSKTKLSTKHMTEEDSYSSKVEAFELPQNTPEQLVEDTGTASSQVQPTIDDNKANNAAGNQSKAKGKWNKNKKAKKRLASASQNISQKESGGREISPSVLEISAMIPKEGPQMDDHLLISTPTTSGSLSLSVFMPGRLQEPLVEAIKDSKDGPMAGVRAQYNYDTLPRGRPDFRNSAGGSLKIPKKRKNRYPTITSKTFDASATGNFETTLPEYVPSGPMPTSNTDGANVVGSVTHATAPDQSKKSRLNPLATAFESPRKAAAATTAGAEIVPNYPRAASFRTGSGEESLRKSRSPSKIKFIQRPATVHNSLTKVSPPKGRLIRQSDGSKTASSFEVSTRLQENNPNEIQRDWSKDKHRQERENKDFANLKATSPRRDCGKTRAALDTEDWPSLPASRVRSATLE